MTKILYCAATNKTHCYSQPMMHLSQVIAVDAVYW